MHLQSPFFLLDTFSAEDLTLWEEQKDKILRYYWNLYNDLAYQRHKIADQLCKALLEAAVSPYEFTEWQRQVRYKYSLTPLSPNGSLIEPGGRFNIPDINSDHIPPFPALYIAEDRETVLQEAGQKNTHSAAGLSGLELALVKKESISIIAVSGRLESIIDLHQPKRLKSFLNLIKKFSVLKENIQFAKEININTPKTTRSFSSLINTLLEPNWRSWCMQFDIPANCQIFGQLVMNAGIEGILYPSKFSKKKCLAIFPQNFESESFIDVEGDVPQGAMSRLDMSSWTSVKATF